MVTKLGPKLVLATLAAVSLYIPSAGLPPTLEACLRTVGVAGATPSPTCAGDLRECLRLSAREGIYGARYVTAEDVARCTEAFNACTDGGAGTGGDVNPPASTPAGGATKSGLPQRFGINVQGIVSDCRVDGDTVVCTESWETEADSYTGEFTGRLAGLTLSGTRTTRRTGHSPEDPGCLIEETYSGPVTYTFKLDGSAEFTAGPNQRQSSFSGSCSGSNSGTTAVVEGTARWSAIE